MYRARRTFVATSMVALLAVAGVTAAIAADPAPAPPPRIAFLANGIVPADALAAGPIAGQLGAPVYTTQQDALPAGTAAALDAYDPQLVVVMGGPVAISDAVVAQVSAATGLPAVEPTPTPNTGVVRAAGGDRFETATIVADLLAAYAPAYLPVDLKAVDADKLDGKDSSEFALKSDLGAGGGDADTLDGKDSTDFLGKTQKAADADKLDGVSAEDLRFISIPVTSLFPDGSASFVDGNGTANGFRLPDAGFPTAALNVTLPPDYTPGDPVKVRSNWRTSNTSCGISLQHNLLSVARPGQVPDGDQGQVIGNELLTAPATSNIVQTVEAQVPAAVDAINLAPGTSITLGLFRNGGAVEDTCTADLVLDGVYIVY